jgi:C1A family cysteine protease
MKQRGKLGALALSVALSLLVLAAPAYADVSQYKLGCKPSPQDVLQSHYSADYVDRLLSNTRASASIDWSANMPKPGDQGQQGSCVGWSTGYNYKSYQEQVERQWGLSTTSHLFSPSYIYNQINGGRDAGATIAAALNLLVSQGNTTLDDFPYNERDYKTQPTQAQRQRAAQYKALSWTPIFRGTANINAMKTALANGPIEIGTDVYWRAGWQTGEINQRDVPSSYSDGGHAVVIVGYDDNRQTKDGTGAFKFINSWGTGWGYGGYGWMSYQYVQNNVFEAEVLYDKVDSNTASISVTAPAGGESWQTGTAHAISWAYTGNPGASVKLDLLNSGAVFATISASASIGSNGSGSYNWTVPASLAAGSYQIRVSGTSNAAVSGTSNAFTVSAAPAPASAITITSPKSGVRWAKGKYNMIYWKYTGNPGPVKIELLKGGSLFRTITSRTSTSSNGTGYYSYHVSIFQASGSNFQVRVTSINDPRVTSTSSYFSIGY